MSKKTDTNSASVHPVVIREFWIIQERIGFIPSAWRDCGRHKQEPSKWWDKLHAIKTVKQLRDAPTGTLEYRIVRRLRHDYETEL